MYTHTCIGFERILNGNSREESRAIHSAYSKQRALCTSSDYAMKASDS